MKKQYIILALGAMFMASCADEFDRNYNVDRPAKTTEYAYLNDYKALKEYVADPNFHLGVGTDAAEYANQGAAYVITNVNFNETVAGNAMKMASCVDDNGNLNFGTVESYVNEAVNAGVNVYGHTLAWHAQQPVKWLNSLLKDKELDVDPNAKLEKLINTKSYENTPDGPFPHYAMGCEPPIVNGALHYVPNGSWNQFFIFPGGENTLAEGDYLVRLYMTADKDADGVQLTVQNGWGGDAQNMTVSVPVKAGKQVYELNYPAIVGGNYDCILKPQTADVTLDVAKIEFYKLENPAVEVEQEVNVKTYTDGPFPFYAMGCEPPVVNGAIHFVPSGNWSQFFCFPGGENPLTEGDYVVYLDLQADKEASGVQFTMQNGWGGDAQNITAAVPVEAGRQTYKLKFPAIVGGNYDCILKPQTADATLDLYSVTVCKVLKLNAIPLTDQEKKDTLIYAMDKWINGIMDACKDDDGNMLVKAWDVVNEPIGANGQLQHGQEGDKENFFWQDYLGDLDYVRTAVKLARQYGGNDLKLFVNDYNLEYDWDAKGNTKLESLISWIKKWEEDGVTKIDGIGSQMHLSCYGNADEQAKRKALIEKSFEMMAATGKLVRVSELDMGYVDADGNAVKTADMTEEMHHQMADFYKWIIETYMAKVPAAQQWGITLWCPTDAPAGSGWRAGEPVGIWDQNYYRKHVYAGIADGLSGK